MSFASKVKNGGWGAMFLWIYFLAVLLLFDIKFGYQRLMVVSIAAIPSLIVMFAVEQAINFLNDWWAGGNLKQSAEIAHETTGADHPFEALESEAQSRINKFDDLAYGHQVSIITGFIIGLTAPFVGFLAFQLQGLIGGVLLAVVAVWLFSYRSVQELNNLATGLADVYQHSYEN